MPTIVKMTGEKTRSIHPTVIIQLMTGRLQKGLIHQMRRRTLRAPDRAIILPRDILSQFIVLLCLVIVRIQGLSITIRTREMNKHHRAIRWPIFCKG